MVPQMSRRQVTFLKAHFRGTFLRGSQEISASTLAQKLSTRSNQEREDQESSGRMGAVVGGVSAAALAYLVYAEKER